MSERMSERKKENPVSLSFFSDLSPSRHLSGHSTDRPDRLPASQPASQPPSEASQSVRGENFIKRFECVGRGFT